MHDALADTIGVENLAVQGVDYPASLGGYLEGGDPNGAATMAGLVEKTVAMCPDSKIVLGGYRSVIPHPRLLILMFFPFPIPLQPTTISPPSLHPS